MAKKYTLHVISNTHWDREWRHPFQRMRMDLVELMDRLLEICETEPDFKHYHLDSQTICVEDYLEIRPEKRELVSKHVKNGKILIGPWYTLPDMFLVSGESTVRNLLTGHKVVTSLGGKAMKVGYTPTSYGQTSQIAQIYKGFDIDSIFYYRGLDSYGIEKSEYILEAADGTQILGLKPTLGYTRFLYRWKVFGGTIRKDGAPDPWVFYHPIDADSYKDGYSMLHANFDKVFNTDNILFGIDEAKKETVPMATTEHLLMMDGFDASYPHANSGKSVAWANKQKINDTIIHQAFPKYIEAVKKSVNWKKLQVVKGERRTPARDTMGTSLMQGVLTSHSYFKRTNHDTQTLLEKYAEPLSAFSWMLGGEYRAGFINLAWKQMLSNHGHDTICGASVDQIYSDAMDRLKQSQMIAHHTALRSERDIVVSITDKKNPIEGQTITVFNSLAFQRSEIVEAYVDFPQSAKVKEFTIEDFNGKKIPFQVLGKDSHYGVAEHGDVGYPPYFVDQYKVSFLADAIPGLGYKCFRVLTQKSTQATKGSLVKSANSMENDFVKVAINKNGTIDLTDKAAGKTYKGMGFFEDGADAGTPWFYRRPAKDKIVTTQKAKATIKLIENKPMSAIYRVEVTMDVPEALTPDKSARVKTMKKIKFSSLLRLTSTMPYVQVSTTVDTPVRDHRVRVSFPTNIKTDRSFAESAFDLVDRKINWKEDASKWIDCEVGIQPQQTFMDLTDGKTGLAILNRGLREYEVSQDASRTISLTLLRGIRYPKIAGGEGCKDDINDQVACQCMGNFTFDYAIYPHKGDWRKGEVYREARVFNVPLRMGQMAAGVRVKNPELSFLSFEPKEIVLSALKVAESGKSLIVRVFNPTDAEISGTFTVAKEIKRARLVNLNEEPLAKGELKLKDANTFTLSVPHKKIVTVELFIKR